MKDNERLEIIKRLANYNIENEEEGLTISKQKDGKYSINTFSNISNVLRALFEKIFNVNIIAGTNLFSFIDAMSYMFIQTTKACISIFESNINIDKATGTNLDNIVYNYGMLRQQATSLTVAVSISVKKPTTINLGDKFKDVYDNIYTLQNTVVFEDKDFALNNSMSTKPATLTCDIRKAINMTPNLPFTKIASDTNIVEILSKEYAQSFDLENDEELRKRFKTFQRGKSLDEKLKIINVINNLPNVLHCNIYTNWNHTTDNMGVKRGETAIIVEGGDDKQIAEAIFENISMGAILAGKKDSVSYYPNVVHQMVYDKFSYLQEIMFYRTVLMDLHIKIEWIYIEGAPRVDNLIIEEAIKKEIAKINNELTLGENVRKYNIIRMLLNAQVLDLSLNNVIDFEVINIGTNQIDHENIIEIPPNTKGVFSNVIVEEA